MQGRIVGLAPVDMVAAMEAAGAPDRTRLWAMVETPEAVFNVREIAAASPRLAVLVMGTNDLVKERRADHVPGRAPLLTALQLSLLAAREAGIAILDGSAFDTPSTRKAAELVADWGERPTLVVVTEEEELLVKSFRNLEKVLVTVPGELEVSELVWARSLLVSEAALPLVQRRGADVER